MNIIEEIRRDLSRGNKEKNKELSDLTKIDFDFFVNKLKEYFPNHELLKVTYYTNQIYLHGFVEKFNSNYYLINRRILKLIENECNIKTVDSDVCKVIHLYNNYQTRDIITLSSDIILNTYNYFSNSKDSVPSFIKVYDNREYKYFNMRKGEKTPFILSPLNKNYSQEDLNLVCMSIVNDYMEERLTNNEHKLMMFNIIKGKLEKGTNLKSEELLFLLNHINNEKIYLENDINILRRHQ